MLNIIRRDLLKVAAGAAAQSAIWPVLPSWASDITSSPTILGNGGHDADNPYFPAGNYYSNVGLGRCVLKNPPFMGTEPYVTQRIHVPGTISYLSWGMDFPFGPPNVATPSLVFKLNKNSSNSQLAISFTNTTGWITDNTHTVEVEDGDSLDFNAYIPMKRGPFSNSAFFCASARFDAVNGSAQLLATVGESNVLVSSTPKYVNFLGILGNEDDADQFEPNQQFDCLLSGTWKYLAGYIDSYDVTSDGVPSATTINSRISGSNGYQAITVYGTGSFEDTSGQQDDVSFSNYLDYQITAANNGSGSISMVWLGAHLIASPEHAESAPLLVGGAPMDPNRAPQWQQTLNSGVDYCSSLFGGGDPSKATDDNKSLNRATGLAPFAFTASNYASFLISPFTAGNVTFNLWQNKERTTLSVSSSGQTGWLIDQSDSVSFAQTDTCTNYMAVSGHSGTSVTWAGTSLLVTPT